MVRKEIEHERIIVAPSTSIKGAQPVVAFLGTPARYFYKSPCPNTRVCHQFRRCLKLTKIEAILYTCDTLFRSHFRSSSVHSQNASRPVVAIIAATGTAKPRAAGGSANEVTTAVTVAPADDARPSFAKPYSFSFRLH